MSRLRVALFASVLLITGLTAPTTVGAAQASVSPRSAPVFGDADGIHVVSAEQVDPRLWKLAVSSPALGRAVRLRILLPAGYAGSTRRYPVLYLFHGTSGGPDDWLQAGHAEATTAGLPLIVVMPDAGFDNDGGGWFTNWWDTHTALGPSQWETFHVDQLVPWTDHALRTVATRSGRAIAGLSQGGFGAMSYAARHPDMFAAAASFSGAPDIASDPLVEAAATGVIEATATGLDGVEPAAMFGPHATNEINWQAHNPATIVGNLRGMNLSLWTATGIPGALDGPTPDPAASGIEFITHVSTLSFTQRAQQAAVPYYLDDYVFGTHTFPYWARDLQQFLPRLMPVFAHPSTPAKVSYEAVDKTWTQWGWTVSNDRVIARAFSELRNASPAGFTLAGPGSAAVTTPASYRPGSAHVVTVVAGNGVRTSQTIGADRSGHLHVSVALSPAAQVPGTATVTISR